MISLTSDEYRAWWEANTDVPYGFCWCGCHKQTPITNWNDKRRGLVSGCPTHFLKGHSQELKYQQLREQVSEPNSAGLCMCGCGEPAPISKQTDVKKGLVKGRPKRYVSKHQKLSPERQEEIVQRYQAGESAYELAEVFGVNNNSIYPLLEARSIKRRSLNTFNETEEQAVCNRYLAGEPIRSIAGDFNIRYESLWGILKRRGIDIRATSEFGYLYHCDHHFFDDIDTEEKAYVLGFIVADGHIHKNEDRLTIGLQPDDREHLVRIKYALKSTHPVKDYSSYSKFHERVTTQSVLNIGSSAIVRALEQHGVGRTKTFTVQWPHHLRPDLLRHFLRGAIDGDGSLWYKSRRKPNGHGWTHSYGFSLIGSWPFITDVQEYLVQAAGLGYTKFEVKPQSPDVVAIRYGGRRQVECIFRLLYDNANIFMLRKYYKLATHFSAPYDPGHKTSDVVVNSAKLHKLMSEANVGVVALSRKASLNRHTVAHLAHNKEQKARPATVNKLAKALEARPRDLLDD